MPTFVTGPANWPYTFTSSITNRATTGEKIISYGTVCLQTNGGIIQPGWSFTDCEFTHRDHPPYSEPNPNPPANDPFYLTWPGAALSEADLYSNGNPAWNNKTDPKWGIRARGVRNWLFDNCTFRWTTKEHGVYDDNIGNGAGTFDPADGMTEYRNCLFDSCAAQAIQTVMRRDGMGGSQSGGQWTTPPAIPPPYEGLIYVHDCTFFQNGHWHGRGRAAFGFAQYGTRATAGTQPWQINTGWFDFIAPQKTVFMNNIVSHDHLAVFFPWVSTSPGTPGAMIMQERAGAWIENNIFDYRNMTKGPMMRLDYVIDLSVTGNSINPTGAGGAGGFSGSVFLDDPTNVIWSGNTGTGTVRIRNRPSFTPGQQPPPAHGNEAPIDTGVSFAVTDTFTIANGVVGAVPSIPANPIGPTMPEARISQLAMEVQHRHNVGPLFIIDAEGLFPAPLRNPARVSQVVLEVQYKASGAPQLLQPSPVGLALTAPTGNLVRVEGVVAPRAVPLTLSVPGIANIVRTNPPGVTTSSPEVAGTVAAPGVAAGTISSSGVAAGKLGA